MIRVSVLYPPSSKFDWDYYLGKHVPLLRERLGKALKAVTVDKGMAGGQPGTPPGFPAMIHMTFDSADAFQKAFAPHAKDILSDIPNYTNAQPLMQVSDVKA
jgi:uncharacterized protein (TIGR02118 family)